MLNQKPGILSALYFAGMGAVVIGTIHRTVHCIALSLTGYYTVASSLLYFAKRFTARVEFSLTRKHQRQSMHAHLNTEH